MPRKLGPKLILSLTILIVAISCVSEYLNFRTQKKRLVETMILGADQLSRSITSATWHAMLDDDRKAAYEIMRVIADKQGVDRIRMFNREGRLAFSTDVREQPSRASPSDEVCISCHGNGPIKTKPAEDLRVRYATSPDGIKTIDMVTPIYNEPSELGKDISGISAAALNVLITYNWPGNVRELENVIERAIVTCRSSTLDEHDFSWLQLQPGSLQNWEVPDVPLDELERLAITAALERKHGNVKEASAALGIDRSTLYDKLKRYEISH